MSNGKHVKPEAIPAPEENIKPLDYREQFQGRHVSSKFIDPCEAASKASLGCMDRNDYDRDACLEYFQAYRECKKTWIQQRKEDRRAATKLGRNATVDKRSVVTEDTIR